MDLDFEKIILFRTCRMLFCREDSYLHEILLEVIGVYGPVFYA